MSTDFIYLDPWCSPEQMLKQKRRGKLSNRELSASVHD
jgi:hypothetical protein